MLGPEVLAACEIVQHDADDLAAYADLGPVPGSHVSTLVDQRFLAADSRITVGFVEPHFFAGSSGGPKVVAPGLAALDTINELHSVERIRTLNRRFLTAEQVPAASGRLHTSRGRPQVPPNGRVDSEGRGSPHRDLHEPAHGVRQAYLARNLAGGPDQRQGGDDDPISRGTGLRARRGTRTRRSGSPPDTRGRGR